jgi:hypothetical protein
MAWRLEHQTDGDRRAADEQLGRLAYALARRRRQAAVVDRPQSSIGRSRR